MFHQNLTLDPGSIAFVSNAFYYDYNKGSIKILTKLGDLDHSKLFLLSTICDTDFFDNIPKTFTITTKNTTLHFNLQMLKETSPVISKFLQDNPNENNYKINITDDENSLAKVEKLYQGKRAVFTENEIPIIKQFTQLLKIKCFPNYLKPSNLFTNEIDSLGRKSYNSYLSIPSQRYLLAGVQIYKGWLKDFLARDEFKTFKIITKKKEYMCCFFGVFTSHVIYQLLEKDSTIDEFTYDFEDDENEFQQICDFFNCKKVDITNTNMDLLKKIAEDLQIQCILKSVDNFINNYEKVNEKIDEQQNIIDSIDDLFDLLFNIKNHGIEKVKDSIVNSKWSKKERYVEDLAAFILQVVKPSFSLQNEIVDLLIKLNKEANDQNALNILIPFIIKKLMTLYWPQKNQTIDDDYDKQTKSQINGLILPMRNKLKPPPLIHEKINLTNRCVYSFIRLLYKRELMPKEEMYEKLRNYDLSYTIINVFFLPELVEIDPKNADNILRMCKSKNSNRYVGNNFRPYFNDSSDEFYLKQFIKNYLPDKIELYEKMLDNMESTDELTKALIIDDIDTLQKIIIRDKIDIANGTVPYNIFDNFEEKLSLINYAAYCGSVKCFKYLMLNDANITDSTFYFAICGHNNEIIKIVEQRNGNSNVKVDDDNLNKSIQYYHIDDSFSDVSFWFNFNDNSHSHTLNRNNKSYNKFDDDVIQCKKILECNRTIIMNYININNIIAPTIALHQNDYFDWIFENLFVSKGKIGINLRHIAILAASTGNIHALIAMIDNGFFITKNIISYAAKNGFYKLTQLLLDFYNKETADGDFNSSNSEDSFDYNSIVHFGNLSIFKLFVNNINQENLEKAFLHSIEINCTSIIQYIFNNLNNFDFTINNDYFIRKALMLSIKTNTYDVFNFLIEQFKKLKPNLFKLNLFTDFLNQACLTSNLAVAETITDRILSENPKNDFTDAFFKASSTKSTNICQYFINKKVFIDFVNSPNISDIAKVDVELFEQIINSVDPNLKFLFYECIDIAIQCKNMKLIEFILKEKRPVESELFYAVKTNDLEVVELILKYNNEPSFVNKRSKTGAALEIASANRNAEIVKYLLSVPGIDLYLANINSALSIAIRNTDFDIIDPIISYIENSNIEIPCIVLDCIQDALKNNSFNNNAQLTQNYWDTIRRIIKLKPFDPNYLNLCNDNSTPLLFMACYFDKFDIVESLLKFENINVNVYDVLTYNTPLIISLEKNNLKMAKLLINHPKTNINMQNNNNESPLIVAIKKNQQEIIDLLLKDERFDPIESRLNFGFIYANTEIVNLFNQSKSLDVNLSYYIYQKELKKAQVNALIHSVEINDEEKIDIIINHPTFNINRSNVQKCIFIAAKNNNINVFQKLIKLINNNINIRNKYDISLLAYSANKLSGDIIDEILNNENFDPKCEQLSLAFAFAYSNFKKSKNNQQQQAQGLWRNRQRYPIQNYHTIPEVNKDVLNPELIPEKSSMIEIMEKLLNYDNEHEHMINFNELLPNGLSYFTAIFSNYPDINLISNFLIQHGVDPNNPDKNGTYPLEHAIKINSLELVTFLVNTEKINYDQPRNGFTYLHLAAEIKDSSILTFLLNKNIIDINSVNILGETPFMHACKLRSMDNINLLFHEDNNDYLHRNNNGKDAIDLFVLLSPEEKNSIKQTKEKFYDALITIINQLNNF